MKENSRSERPPEDTLPPSTARLRRRLNFWILLIPQQWISLVMIYWMRRLMRPDDLVWGLPPALVLALAAIACALPAMLPPSYFRPRGFERGSLYPRLGLRLFRWVAPDGDWVNGRLRRLDPFYRVVGNAETRAAHLASSITNERWHLSWFIFGVVAQAAALSRGEVVWATLLALFNVAFNLFPVLHQRHVRARASRRRRLT